MAKSKSKLIGVYPGTFDPITLGHLDIVERAMKVVDHLVLAVAENPGKGPLFTVEERIALAKTDMKNNKKIAGTSWEVVSFNELLMDFVKKKNGRVIVRGLRAVSDGGHERLPERRHRNRLLHGAGQAPADFVPFREGNRASRRQRAPFLHAKRGFRAQKALQTEIRH